ncbi:Cupredoxin [Cryomyces antarcticus]|nr:hypothetical protein LTR60_001509 [Cryomyces antarcticus]
MPQGCPWGSATVNNTDPYSAPPETGMTRFYDFTISHAVIKPDGVEKNGVVINGAFPGPTIEANWGDWIQVTVHNALEDEGTSLHWHGMRQLATPWFDGVPSVQQCPIAPGSTFTYRFKADTYGTSWYHAHYSAQYSGGALGPLIVYGPKHADYDNDVGPILLTDHFHEEYTKVVEQVMAPISAKLPPPLSNNNLINGKMNYPCSSTKNVCTPNAGVSKFSFQSGKKHRLRLINGGAEGIQKFSIDNHQMTVIANDFVPIQPYTANVITLGVGQRTDIIVEATGKPTDAVWMRSNLGKAFPAGCNLVDGVSPEAVAAIYYEKADQTAIPTTQSSASPAEIAFCGSDALAKTTPYYPITPEANPTTTRDIDIELKSNGTHNLWYMGGSTFRADYNDPVLLEAKLGNTSFPPIWNVHNFGSDKTVRLVVYNHFTLGSHPMHLHGHDVFVLAEGFGKWDGSVVNPSNPQRRDVQLLQAAKDDNTPAYIVIQIEMDNPGVWPFHCHIAWHMSGGLYINVLERPADITNANIPGVIAQTCRDWAAWTGGHISDQIDAGL